jgi:hypothetical protein
MCATIRKATSVSVLLVFSAVPRLTSTIHFCRSTARRRALPTVSPALLRRMPSPHISLYTLLALSHFLLPIRLRCILPWVA